MAAHINIIPQGSVAAILSERYFTITIGSATVMVCSDEKQANTIAMLLNRVRESRSKHEQMHILCHQLWYSEERAEEVLLQLINDHFEEAATNVGSNAFN